MPRTNFSPAANGFAFVNYWTFDPDETRAISEAFVRAVDDVSLVLGPLFNSVFILAGLTRKLSLWCANALPASYGLCGGMAFAALDFYCAQTPVPRDGLAPTRANADGTTMRNYLEKRQLDSLEQNLPAVLAWMALLNLVPGWWSFGGGPAWLLQHTEEQWQILRASIGAGRPQPLALIGTTKDPSENHQVLATGYDEEVDDAGVSTNIIYLYDMNCPGAEQTIRLDFRGPGLKAEESCPSEGRGPLRGFICEQYTAALPPTVRDWTGTGTAVT